MNAARHLPRAPRPPSVRCLPTSDASSFANGNLAASEAVALALALRAALGSPPQLSAAQLALGANQCMLLPDALHPALAGGAGAHAAAAAAGGGAGKKGGQKARKGGQAARSAPPHAVVQLAGKNERDANSAVELYWQLGPWSAQLAAKLSLLDAIMYDLFLVPPVLVF